MTPTESFITLFFPWVGAIMFIAIVCGIAFAMLYMVFSDACDAIKAWKERK